MARTNVPIKSVNRLQVATATVVAGNTVDGMRMSNNGATLLYVDNNAGSDQTIELILVETVDFRTAGPVVVTVPASAAVNLIGPFPINLYGNVLEFDVSSASLDFAAFSLL